MTVLVVACAAVTVALVATLLLLASLPKRRVWPVPEGLGAVPPMRTPGTPADRSLTRQQGVNVTPIQQQAQLRIEQLLGELVEVIGPTAGDHEPGEGPTGALILREWAVVGLWVDDNNDDFTTVVPAGPVTASRSPQALTAASRPPSNTSTTGTATSRSASTLGCSPTPCPSARPARSGSDAVARRPAVVVPGAVMGRLRNARLRPTGGGGGSERLDQRLFISQTRLTRSWTVTRELRHPWP